MLKPKKFSCYFTGCNKSASITCKCLDPSVNSCFDHIEQHSKLADGNHVMVLISSKILGGLNKEEAIKKINLRVAELTGITSRAINASTEIINRVMESLKKILSQIIDMRTTLIEVKRMILADKPIDTEFVNTLMEDYNFNFKIDQRQIIELIPGIFAFDSCNFRDVDDDYALSAKDTEKGLIVVNLKTFKASIFPKAAKNWSVAGACRISHNKYFLTGGRCHPSYFNHTSIVNLNENTEEVLPQSSTSKALSGCIMKDDKVYTFGGFNGSSLISAEMFDLSTMKWSALPNLPAASYPSSTLINNKIVLAGTGLSYAYIFEKNSYKQNLAIPSAESIACDKWIFTSTKLYECQNLDAIQWGQYNIKYKFYPAIWTAYKNSKYIYFMVQDQSLWRINTESKSAEKINYT